MGLLLVSSALYSSMIMCYILLTEQSVLRGSVELIEVEGQHVLGRGSDLLLDAPGMSNRKRTCLVCVNIWTTARANTSVEHVKQTLAMQGCGALFSEECL